MFFWYIFFTFFFIFPPLHCKSPLHGEEKKIVLVSCCYNAAASIHQTLDSIFSQKYSNFRVVLVNDASTDNTKELIDAYLENFSEFHDAPHYQVYHNDVRRRKLANLYPVLHECDPDEIVFLLDGDDWLFHDHVLTRINQAYEESEESEENNDDDPSVWMTFGDYQNYPAYEAKEWGVAEGSYCTAVSDSVIEQLLYRKKPFVYMHPRTFYAWLFQQVKLGDLITERISEFAGDFFPACNDLAMFFPMVELAGTHVKFIDEVLYCRNVESDLVGFKVDSVLQRQAAHEIRRKTVYQPLLLRPEPRQLSVSNDVLFIVDDVLLVKNGAHEFKMIGYLKQSRDIRVIIQALANVFCYCVICQTKDKLSIMHIDFEYAVQLLEQTGCPLCLFSQKPARVLLLSDSVYVWKRSLNLYLPDVDICMISLTDLARFVQQKNVHATIHEVCDSYIQSFQYDVALSMYF